MRSHRRFALLTTFAALAAAACLTFCTTALAVPVPVPADANRCQLVLVVRFAGDATGDGATGLNAPYPYGDAWRTKWEQVSNDLNGSASNTYDSQTLYAYIKKVSGGACRLGSVAPQQDAATGAVAYLTLPGTRTSYSTSESVAADAVAAFAAAYPDFDASSVDRDGDGMVDNVMVVPEVGEDPPSSGADPLWPRKSNLGSAVVLGRPGSTAKAYTYTMVDTDHLVSVGTLAHETMHALGAKDLYRRDADLPSNRGRAVGVWDIMAEHGGSKLMWPLAVSRKDCGWTTVGDVGAGTHTLYAPASGKTQAVAVRSPLSDSEFFVVEYRKANTDIGDLSALDTSQEGSPMTIGGSGLLVYRVNTSAKAEGNTGDRDYVYLFRPGETGDGRGDGTGDVRNAQLSLGGRASLGSSDLSAGLADGAITLSDGQNSGIVVKVTSETPDSATFELSVTQGQGNLWTVAGSGTLPASDAVESKVAASGETVLQAVQTGVGGASKIYAATYANDGWGQSALVASGQELKAVTMSGNDAYVLAAAYGSPNRFTLYRRSGTGPWTAVTSVAASGTGATLAVVGGTGHVAVEDKGVQVYRLEGSCLVAVGPKVSSGYVAALSLLDVGGSPAVAIADFDAATTGVWRLSGSSWNRVWSRAGSVNGLDSTAVGTTAYLYVKNQDGSGSVVSVPSSGSPSATDVAPSVPRALDGSLTASGGSLFLAVSA